MDDQTGWAPCHALAQGEVTPTDRDTSLAPLHKSRILALVKDGLRGGPHPRPRQQAPT
jgi:hypothetical protein